MNPLEPPDLHYLNAAKGWLELGNNLAAIEEWEKIDPSRRSHPDVLELGWCLYANSEKWESCLEIALALISLIPEKATHWIYLAYATRQAKANGLTSARKILLDALEVFPEDAGVLYNLACYSCQLGELKAAWIWLAKAFSLSDPDALKNKALNDADLEPLWVEIEKHRTK